MTITINKKSKDIHSPVWLRCH